jgi:hypothetical protein
MTSNRPDLETVLPLTQREHLDPALRLTAVALLLRPMGPWFVAPFLLLAAILALLFPRALRSPLLWGAVAILVTIRIADDWPLADNHIYLLGFGRWPSRSHCVLPMRRGRWRSAADG